MLTFIGGLVILRQSHAIWSMDSPNAVTLNCTMNTVFSMNPVFELIVCVIVVCAIACLLTGFVGRGF